MPKSSVMRRIPKLQMSPIYQISLEIRIALSDQKSAIFNYFRHQILRRKKDFDDWVTNFFGGGNEFFDQKFCHFFAQTKKSNQPKVEMNKTEQKFFTR